MTQEGQLVVFNGSKIDGRRVRRRESGRTSYVGGFLSGRIAGEPDEAALTFVETNYQLFAEQPQAVEELQVKRVSQSPAGYHVILQQVHQGIPVEGGQVAVHMTTDRRVHSATNSLLPEATQLDVAAMARDGIDEDEARQIAEEHLRDQEVQAKAVQAQQVILPNHPPRLTWKVFLATARPAHEWTLWIDVSSGEVVEARQTSIQ